MATAVGFFADDLKETNAACDCYAVSRKAREV